MTTMNTTATSHCSFLITSATAFKLKQPLGDWRRGVMVTKLIDSSTWMGDICGRVNHLGMYPVTKVNSAIHPSGVGKLSTGLTGWGEGVVCSLLSGSR